MTPRVALVAAPAASMRPHLVCSLPSHSSRSSDISESRSQRAAKGPLERAGLAGLAAAAVLAAALLLLLLLLLCSASLRRLWAGGVSVAAAGSEEEDCDLFDGDWVRAGAGGA